MKNILVIKLRYIGDVLLATPTLQAIKAAFPASQLTMLVSRGTEDVLKENPHLDHIMVLEKGSLAAQWQFAADLRRRRFDIVIDLTDGDRSAFLSWISGATVRIGFNNERRLRGLCYTKVVQANAAGSHRIERDLAAVKSLGIAPADKMPKLWLTSDDDRAADKLLRQLGVRPDQPIVVLQPGARYWFKAWPSDRFVELADRLAMRCRCQILIGGSREEEDLARRICNASKCQPISLAGQTTLKQFAAVVKRASLFIGNDSGVMHIAAAVGTPVVALFGPSNPAEWGPQGRLVYSIYKGMDCRSCFHPTCRRGEDSCMKQISVDEVFNAARRFLDDRLGSGL